MRAWKEEESCGGGAATVMGCVVCERGSKGGGACLFVVNVVGY